MRIAVGSDGVYPLTDAICAYLNEKRNELRRCGALAGVPADFVDAARETAEAVASGRAEQGVLFCWTGTGVTIVANKIPGVRAALCADPFSARIARLANNANILVLGIRLTAEPLAKETVDAWFSTSPSEEERRLTFHRKIDEIDVKYRCDAL